MLVSPAKRKKSLGVRDVENVIATMARIPPKQVSKDDKLALSTLERDLKMVVFGQDKAIDSLSSAIKLARAGLREPEKPIGSYLFSGPTGVGKTEVAQSIGQYAGHRTRPLRHVGIYGAPQRLPLDRGSSRICRVRSGRHADRRGRSTSAYASCCWTRLKKRIRMSVQHPSAGHGLRQADRSQRQVGRFPQRHSDHDDECGCGGFGEGGNRFWPFQARRR